MIDFAIIKHAWRDMRHRDIRLLFVALLMLQTIVQFCAQVCSWPESYSRCIEAVYPDSLLKSTYWVCILGGGIIGIKISRGTLPLILSRPISTTRFVVSSWLAVASAAFVVQLVFLLLQSLQIYLLMPTEFNGGELLVAIAKSFAICTVTSSVLVFLSSLVGGVKDVGLFFLTFILAQVLAISTSADVKAIQVSWLRHLCQAAVEILERIGQAGFMIVRPELPISTALPLSWNLVIALISCTAIVLSALSLAIFRLNKMEMSYGAD